MEFGPTCARPPGKRSRGRKTKFRGKYKLKTGTWGSDVLMDGGPTARVPWEYYAGAFWDQ